ncbi:MAG TPA: glycosyltransferase family 39 protein [Verrucomicrobiae bacterium]|nr:glycosyltransferase family 39 protein [Verrucomicrobiae bacterium]
MTTPGVHEPRVLQPAGSVDSIAPPARTLLLIAFVLALLPIITDTARFHGDERFYTDAAIGMVESGDFWTPRYPDGSIRLLKPVITYWAAAVPFKLFGISLFSARLLFLLAGVGVIVLTHQLAKTVFRSNLAALFAALMMGSNIQLWTVATRATPDVLLCLFVLISMLGFARIWFLNDRSWIAPLMIYGGMGLAVQTKGLLGLCPLAANLLFWIVARPTASPRRRLLHWPSLLCGLTLALFWYAIMLRRHGWDNLHDFYSDQVGSRLTWSVGFILGNFWTYLFAGVRHFLPWTLLLAGALVWCRSTLQNFWKQHRTECLFLLCLFVPLVFIFGLGNIRRSRYLIASYPMLAVLIAALLSEVSRNETLVRRLGMAVKFLGWVALLLGIALLVLGAPVHGRLGLAGAMLAGVGIIPVLRRGHLQGSAPWLWLGTAALVGFVSFGSCVRPVFSPSPLVDIARQLPAITSPGSTLVTWRVSATDAARLRLMTGSQYSISALKTNMPVPAPTTSPVITTAAGRELILQASYELRPVTNRNERLRQSRFGRLALSVAEKSRTHAIPGYWIGIPPQPPGLPPQE